MISWLINPSRFKAGQNTVNIQNNIRLFQTVLIYLKATDVIYLGI